MLVARFVTLIFNGVDPLGIFNQLREIFGGPVIDFYNDPKFSWAWLPILIGVCLWKGTGYNLIIYLAGIGGIDQDIYEAARIDGAGRLKQLRHITLPLLVPTVIILTLLSIGRIFYGDFQTVYAIVGTNSNLYSRLDIIETYLYRQIKLTGGVNMYGVSAAVALYQSALGFILIFGSNFIIKLYNKDYALF